MPEVVQLAGPENEYVGYRHAAHGRDAHSARRLLRLGNRTAAAETATQKIGTNDGHGWRDDGQALPNRLCGAGVGHGPHLSEEGNEAVRDLGALAGAELGEEHLCLALGRLQQGRRITADGSDAGVVTEQQCCDLPRAGDPRLAAHPMRGRTVRPGAGQRLDQGHLRPVPGQ